MAICLPTTNLWYQTTALRKAFRIKSWFINLPYATTTILYLREPCLAKKVQRSPNAAIFRSLVSNTWFSPPVCSDTQRWLSALEFAGYGKLCSQAYKHRGILIRSLNVNYVVTLFTDHTHRYPSRYLPLYGKLQLRYSILHMGWVHWSGNGPIKQWLLRQIHFLKSHLKTKLIITLLLHLGWWMQAQTGASRPSCSDLKSWTGLQHTP